MKFVKWKILIITAVICLLPVFLGLSLWENLPDTMAIHFDINNNPDNFASKGFVVFGLPVLMALMQTFCCIVTDLNAQKHGSRKKFEAAAKWIIPVMFVFLQTITLGYGLGHDIDIRKCAVTIVSVIFIVLGNYMPKLDYVKNYNIDTQKARKINRFMGFSMVIMGILFLITIFFPPIFSVIALILLIPYILLTVIYSIAVIRKK
ncbi:MAG: DUF1648 domain-containing protein [Ruminococcaceae bacterium]|nr:DUF1648 domain-containing protein [Oscillospiraceae bacterium]